ncbi:MAG: hypothetical protein J6D36_06955 [Erysipelotrichaceae bacterium]|nr:hypothetical protein [Erysipelotrichaceae bacterium]
MNRDYKMYRLIPKCISLLNGVLSIVALIVTIIMVYHIAKLDSMDGTSFNAITDSYTVIDSLINEAKTILVLFWMEWGLAIVAAILYLIFTLQKKEEKQCGFILFGMNTAAVVFGTISIPVLLMVNEILTLGRSLMIDNYDWYGNSDAYYRVIELSQQLESVGFLSAFMSLMRFILLAAAIVALVFLAKQNKQTQEIPRTKPALPSLPKQ